MGYGVFAGESVGDGEWGVWEGGGQVMVRGRVYVYVLRYEIYELGDVRARLEDEIRCMN